MVHKTLKKHFGFKDFKPFQQEIIEEVLKGRDVLAVLPTGAGKSLCYQLPALEFSGLTLVISPLISLMKDQVEALGKKSIRAAYLNSSLTREEERRIQGEIRRREVKIVYVAPERVFKDHFLSFLEDFSVSLIAIDEAHCISEWGHDFRPEYRKLGNLRSEFPGVPIVALTATATERVRSDIVRQLKFKNPGEFIGSFDRKNLFYEIRSKENVYYDILSYLEDHSKETGIIYCYTRATTERLAEKLRADGIEALPYHAGLSKKDRAEHQEKFQSGEAQVITATIAFGMGIDKPNVRFVFHYDMPKNLEGYYQETGRAGRDGKRSQCTLFFNYRDAMRYEYFIQKTKDSTRAIVSKWQLDQMVDFCTAGICRRQLLLRYFGENYPRNNCGMCDVCAGER